MFEIHSVKAEATEMFGYVLGQKALPGMVFALYGDLGAGKSLLCRGMARGLGIEGYITSPTFTLINFYNSGRLPFYHLDLYRLGCSDELYEIGFDEVLNSAGVAAVEWPEMAEDMLPDDLIVLHIDKGFDGEQEWRDISVEVPQGYAAWFGEVMAAYADLEY